MQQIVYRKIFTAAFITLIHQIQSYCVTILMKQTPLMAD